jgi:HEAT repeat protein
VSQSIFEQVDHPSAEIRASAATFMRAAKPSENAVRALSKLLDDPAADVRSAAAESLGYIGPAAAVAVPKLVELLSDANTNVRSSAAFALGRVGRAADVAVRDLRRLLGDGDGYVRASAVEALGGIGATASAAIPEVLKCLTDANPTVRGLVEPALANIADGLSDINVPDPTSLRHLRNAIAKLAKREDRKSVDSKFAIRIQRAVNHLEALERASVISQVSTWLRSISFTDWKTYAVILPALWLLVLLVVFLAKPLWLLNWAEALKDQLSVKIKPGNTEFSLGIPLRYVSLIRPLAYRPRVLDTWVKRHIDKARENFENLPTVDDRKVHIASPVIVNYKLDSNFSAATLRGHVGKAGHECRWLIMGEGGAGKTSLACRIARWAMAPDKADRIAPHLMIPVLIEDELDDSSILAGPQRLLEAIRGKLKTTIGSAEPISEELLKHLLRQWRVLVIIDHFTEMSEATKSQIRFDSAEFPAAALVVTARSDAGIGNLPKHTIVPMRIKGSQLSIFIDAYLNERRKRHLFDDDEYFDACTQLTRMVGDRDITVLLAKLYADQMVAAKETPTGADLPKNIPDLMLCYLNELNRNIAGEENPTVQRDCKAIAWECLKASYRPGLAERVAVLEALKGDDACSQKPEDRLKYLVNDLRVIQVTGAAEDRIRFVLDPLAEYLAGMQVVKENRGKKRDWVRFLKKADEVPGAPQEIRGFLLAVRDCCLAPAFTVPNFVPDELGRRGGLDPELVERLKIKQRVRRQINNLRSPEASLRLTAAKQLRHGGPAAEEAAPELLRLLKDADPEVRWTAALALAELKTTVDVSARKFLEVLSDADPHVRRSGAYAARAVGAADVVTPELVRLLCDSDWKVRWAAVGSLGHRGLSGVANAELAKLLNDPVERVRNIAADVLGQHAPADADPAPAESVEIAAEVFRGRVDNIRDEVAFTTLISEGGDRLVAQWPKKDLTTVAIGKGDLFELTMTDMGGHVSSTFRKLERKLISDDLWKEIEELRADYAHLLEDQRDEQDSQ